MNEEKILTELSRVARGASSPRIDVTARVLGDIAAPRGGGYIWAFTVASAAAAAAIAVFAVRALPQEPDPFMRMIGGMTGGGL